VFQLSQGSLATLISTAVELTR